MKKKFMYIVIIVCAIGLLLGLYCWKPESNEQHTNIENIKELLTKLKVPIHGTIYLPEMNSGNVVLSDENSVQLLRHLEGAKRIPTPLTNDRVAMVLNPKGVVVLWVYEGDYFKLSNNGEWSLTYHLNDDAKEIILNSNLEKNKLVLAWDRILEQWDLLRMELGSWESPFLGWMWYLTPAILFIVIYVMKLHLLNGLPPQEDGWSGLVMRRRSAASQQYPTDKRHLAVAGQVFGKNGIVETGFGGYGTVIDRIVEWSRLFYDGLEIGPGGRVDRFPIR